VRGSAAGVGHRRRPAPQPPLLARAPPQAREGAAHSPPHQAPPAALALAPALAPARAPARAGSSSSARTGPSPTRDEGWLRDCGCHAHRTARPILRIPSIGRKIERRSTEISVRFHPWGAHPPTHRTSVPRESQNPASWGRPAAATVRPRSRAHSSLTPPHLRPPACHIIL
jgi:hypothetical protein